MESFSRMNQFQRGFCSFISTYLLKSDFLQRTQQAFQKFNEDKTGTINLAEFQQAMRELQESKNLSDEDVSKIFQSIDAEQSGSINYQNFIASAGRRDIKLCAQNLQLAFEVIERDTDHKITAAELSSYFDFDRSRNRDGDIEAWREVIDQCENTDGEISLEQFT